jgi:hypothetical protein
MRYIMHNTPACQEHTSVCDSRGDRPVVDGCDGFEIRRTAALQPAFEFGTGSKGSRIMPNRHRGWLNMWTRASASRFSLPDQNPVIRGIGAGLARNQHDRTMGLSTGLERRLGCTGNRCADQCILAGRAQQNNPSWSKPVRSALTRSSPASARLNGGRFQAREARRQPARSGRDRAAHFQRSPQRKRPAVHPYGAFMSAGKPTGLPTM